MDTLYNKGVDLQLDSDTGMVRLTHLLNDTIVYVYDKQGEVQMKLKYVVPELKFKLQKRGMYVVVMMHPAGQLEVRRVYY